MEVFLRECQTTGPQITVMIADLSSRKKVRQLVILTFNSSPKYDLYTTVDQKGRKINLIN